MLGTIVNCITIIVGGLIGSVFGSRIGERYTKPLMTVMGFATAVIGIQGALGTSNILVVIICLALGTLIGVALRLDDRINGSGNKARRRPVFGCLRHGNAGFLRRLYGYTWAYSGWSQP